MQAAVRLLVDCSTWSRLGRVMASLSGAILVLAATPSVVLAQAESEPEWTVLTVSTGGAWGLSTARGQGEAIAGARKQCQSKAGKNSDCGAELVAYKSGWSAALLCGDNRILASGESLEEVKSIVQRRLRDLAASARLAELPAAGDRRSGGRRRCRKAAGRAALKARIGSSSSGAWGGGP
jgi:hypothetical protein